MKSEHLFDARVLFGQGKTATTILTESGCHYPVIHEPYSHRACYIHARSSSVPSRVMRGNRPMHMTTLTIAKPPWSPEYETTHKQTFSGSTSLEPPRRPDRCRSMHTSRVIFGTDEESDRFMSSHAMTYTQKDAYLTRPPYVTSIENKLNQTEGREAREVMAPEKGPQSYWSQYNRTHNILGLIRGPGLSREYPVRQQYDVITGEEKCRAGKPENARVSGNRVLHGFRGKLNTKQVLF